MRSAGVIWIALGLMGFRASARVAMSGAENATRLEFLCFSAWSGFGLLAFGMDRLAPHVRRCFTSYRPMEHLARNPVNPHRHSLTTQHERANHAHKAQNLFVRTNYCSPTMNQASSARGICAELANCGRSNPRRRHLESSFASPTSPATTPVGSASSPPGFRGSPFGRRRRGGRTPYFCPPPSAPSRGARGRGRAPESAARRS